MFEEESGGDDAGWWGCFKSILAEKSLKLTKLVSRNEWKQRRSEPGDYDGQFHSWMCSVQGTSSCSD